MTADQKSRTDNDSEVSDVKDDSGPNETDFEITESSATDDPIETTVDDSGRRTFTIGIAVLGVLILAAAGLTAWIYFALYRVDQQTGPAAAQTALTAAQDGTVAVLSYGPDTLDKDLATAKSHLTGEFLKYYDGFTNDVVRPAVQQKGVKTEAKVVNSAVSEIHPDKAVVLVFVNQMTMSKDRADPSMTASSVRVTLDKVDGNWLISSFDPV